MVGTCLAESGKTSPKQEKEETEKRCEAKEEDESEEKG